MYELHYAVCISAFYGCVPNISHIVYVLCKLCNVTYRNIKLSLPERLYLYLRSDVHVDRGNTGSPCLSVKQSTLHLSSSHKFVGFISLKFGAHNFYNLYLISDYCTWTLSSNMFLFPQVTSSQQYVWAII